MEDNVDLSSIGVMMNPVRNTPGVGVVLAITFMNIAEVEGRGIARPWERGNVDGLSRDHVPDGVFQEWEGLQ
jgi:hypothetical protein